MVLVLGDEVVDLRELDAEVVLFGGKVTPLLQVTELADEIFVFTIVFC